MEESVLRELATTIPEYWREHLDEKIKKIHENQAKAGPDGISFGLISDIHWRTNKKHSAALLEKVLHDCCISYFFNAGDLFSGQGICKPEDIISEFIDYRKLFARIESKCLMVEGNHDATYSTFEAPDYYAQNLSFDEFYEYYFRHQAQYTDREFGENGTYYYVDDKFRKTRLIVLNVHDVPNDDVKEDGRPVYNRFRPAGTGIMQRQLDWFAHVALDVPSPDWTVVLATHEPMCFSKRDGVRNYGMVLDIINAFSHHTSFEGETEFPENFAHYHAKVSVDYTGKGGNFAIWVGGHTHYDLDLVLEGVLSTATLNDGMHNEKLNNTPHVEGTTTEQAFDIFTIDKTNHKIYITRIGAGNDREFEYQVY